MPDLVEVRYDAPALPVVGSALQAASLVAIDDQTTYELADDRLGEIKRTAKAIEAQRKAIVDPINKAKDAVQALFKPVLDDLAAAEGHIKGLMLGYQREQDNRRRQEQARLDEEARKQKAKLEAQAEKAAAKGHDEKAAVLAATAAVTAPAVATSTYVQPKGLSVRKVHKARVLDKIKLIHSILGNPAFLYLLSIDEAALNKLAVATQGNIPLEGVEVYEEETLAKRAA